MFKERIVINQNENWLLSNGEEKFFLTNDIDGEDFQKVNLPHIWNVQDDSDYEYTNMWYTKTIYIDKEYRGKCVYLEFEGAYNATEVYVNFRHIPYSYDNPYDNGNVPEYVHKGSYGAFRFDITDYVVFGEENTVTVSVSNELFSEISPLEGDFNNKVGIYKDLFLVITDKVHIDAMNYGSSGIYLTTEKVTSVEDNSNKDFNLTLETPIVNKSEKIQNVTVEAVLWESSSYEMVDNDYVKKDLRFKPEDMYTEGGKQITEFNTVNIKIVPKESYDYKDTVFVKAPRLWNGLDDPYRYEVEIKIYVDGKLVDSAVQKIGFKN